ncbi:MULTISPECIES: glycosyltransferase family 4 protein [unclassified Streptomyces]|uniref:glycosyltransferase family 4 protein n=1 Tax=unclassified Streptomyces TaxID=2593676 RepID=UPI0033FE826A
MKIAFLLQNAYGIGGTIRATFNAASALAERHDVHIVTVWRTEDRLRLPLSGHVTLLPLIDKRRQSLAPWDSRLRGQPSQLVPPLEAQGAHFDRLTDRKVARYLARTDADVVVATRPGLVIYLAAFGRGHYLKIGQEHRTYGTHEAGIRAVQDAAIAALDAHTTVSEADAVVHRRHLAHLSTPIRCLPNASPRALTEPSDGTAPLIIAGGRLIPAKQYGLLIDAFATVAATHPHWKLRIYGRGPGHAALRARIEELGLSDHISLMGVNASLATEWAKASIAAVTSREESFGMTIVEAMQCGVPVVATDCPHGPREIIQDGEDGLLVPNGNSGAVAQGLMTLIADADLRRAMGNAARRNVQRYEPVNIAQLYESLIADLHVMSPPAPRSRTHRMAAGIQRVRTSAHRALRSTPSSAGRTKGGAPGPRPPLHPKARCHVDAAGDLVIRLDRAGMKGSAFTLTAALRKSEGRTDDVISLPLRRPGPGADTWTATLHRGDQLAEGRWDFHVHRSDDGVRRRVASEAVDQRCLLTLEPLPSVPFSWWIPYTTVKGNLSVRTWRRPMHAEARKVNVDATSFSVMGTLHGTEPQHGDHPRLLAVPRRRPSAAFEADLTVSEEGVFHFTVAHSQALHASDGQPEVWDLWLRLSPGSQPVRVARILGDLIDRKRTDVYTATDTPHPQTGISTRLRPYFTVNNDLALRLSPVPLRAP